MSGEESDPVAWLRAAIEDDLALARRVKARWVVPADRPNAGKAIWPAPSVEGLMVFHGEDPDVNAGLDLIWLCNPTQVVADCEAKLAILDEHAPEHATFSGEEDGWGPHAFGCRTCAREEFGIAPDGWCRTFLHLLGAYRLRSGYDEKWASSSAARS